jgi:DUF1680 family protein
MLTNMRGQEPAAPFQIVKPVAEIFSPIRFSEITPAGWLANQIRQNLAGSIGHLDRLVPDLMVKDDIYGRDRLSKKVKSKDVGAVVDPGDWQVQILWWNSESQGNWLDGFCRSAALSGDAEQIARADSIIARLLSTQDTDGYLGIYDPDLRYKFDGENGELWSKTVLFRALLAWYEYRGNRKILDAVVRAVGNVMENYPAGMSHPFSAQKPMPGGMTHGLMFTDVLESLFRITGEERYHGYALFLYRDFTEHFPAEDAALSCVLDPLEPLTGHGVHTYEHLRAIAAAWTASGNPALRRALENYLGKIESATTPAGGPIGDEFIGGRTADATAAGYEYCSLQELMHGYTDLLMKTGEAEYGDAAEKLFFNAAQGARHPENSLIAYLKSDNSFAMNGILNDDPVNPKQTRYKYSAVHQDAAVCCIPNAGRITPYFIQRMWMRSSDGLVATLLGPCALSTTVNGKPVRIEERTEYPAGNSFVFTIDNPGEVPFLLSIRKPAWAQKAESIPSAEAAGNYLVFQVGKRHETIALNFSADVEIRSFHQEHFFTLGALVYARPIPHRETLRSKYPVSGFEDRYYLPEADTLFALPTSPAGRAVWNEQERRFLIETMLVNTKTRLLETVLLRPVGSTILRQVTFK